MAAIEIVTTAVPGGRATIEYETYGDPADPAFVLIGGFGTQLTSWEPGFCAALAGTGRFVVVFDNRDAGLSTKLDGQTARPMEVLKALLAGSDAPPVPYDLSDMANDVVGLLDALGIEGAHVAGASMGGMIAQTVAIDHPARVLSLTSIMSTVGDPRIGAPTTEARAVLLDRPQRDRAGFIEQSANTAVWASRRHVDVEQIKHRAGLAFDRSFAPEGLPRQLAAIYASGDRRPGLAGVTAPTLVIHGRDDTLIAPDGGEATAAAIPGAHLLLVADMGHDLPEPLWPLIVATMSNVGR